MGKNNFKDACFAIERSAELQDSIEFVSLLVSALNLTETSNNGLVDALTTMLKNAEHNAYMQGFEKGIKVTKDLPKETEDIETEDSDVELFDYICHTDTLHSFDCCLCGTPVAYDSECDGEYVECFECGNKQKFSDFLYMIE